LQGINVIYTRWFLIYARKKGVKYATMLSMWVIIFYKDDSSCLQTADPSSKIDNYGKNVNLINNWLN